MEPVSVSLPTFFLVAATGDSEEEGEEEKDRERERERERGRGANYQSFIMKTSE